MALLARSFLRNLIIDFYSHILFDILPKKKILGIVICFFMFNFFGVDMVKYGKISKNVKKIKELFPNCATETKDKKGKITLKIDFETLKQELSDDIICENQEKYEFTWPGKKASILLANQQTDKILVPCKDESVNWDTTQNLYIEGDNLEVLKILRSTYFNKVKLIYIDPPYNTGENRLYKDKFTHSDWLNMMYPRLKIARDLLTDDGVIFISIDDHEVHNLRKFCDEIFGSEQYLITIIQNKGNAQNDAENFQLNYDYILVYAKQQSKKLILEEFNLTKELKFDKLGFYYLGSSIVTGGAGGTLNNRPNLGYTIYYNPSTLDKIAVCDYNKELAKISNDEGKIYHNNVNLVNKGYIPIRAPKKGKLLGRWTWSLEKFNTEKDKIIIKKSGNKYNVLKKEYIDSKVISTSENKCLVTLKKYKNVKSIWNFSSSLGTTTLNDLFKGKIFNNPKNLEMIKYILNINAIQNHIVLDFFSGSATTAHAVMQLNAEDGGNRKFIMVQLPEVCDEKSIAFKEGYKNICEIGKERIRRAGKKIIEETGKTDLDVGFKVFKVGDKYV